jgi:two-component system cell cycle response regulator DivK
MSAEHVLVVEDNARNLKLVCDVLAATGYRTRTATSGEDAVEAVRACTPALVLLDVQLPGIDGIETLARLRQDLHAAGVPVVAITAQAMDGDRERFLAAGFDDYLAKPIDIRELVATVTLHCGGRSARSS